MAEPTPFEQQQADVARKAMAKGFMLITHNHFSLRSNESGEIVVKEAESLDEVSDFINQQP